MLIMFMHHIDCFACPLTISDAVCPWVFIVFFFFCLFSVYPFQSLVLWLGRLKPIGHPPPLLLHLLIVRGFSVRKTRRPMRSWTFLDLCGLREKLFYMSFTHKLGEILSVGAGCLWWILIILLQLPWLESFTWTSLSTPMIPTFSLWKVGYGVKSIPLLNDSGLYS